VREKNEREKRYEINRKKIKERETDRQTDIQTEGKMKDGIGKENGIDRERERQ
jgi:hypothetical protein